MSRTSDAANADLHALIAEKYGFEIETKFVHEAVITPRWLFWKPTDGDKPRKVPRAPWAQDDHSDKFVSAHDADNWISFDAMTTYLSMYPDHMGYRPAWSIPPREDDLDDEVGQYRDIVLVDFDDVIDTETGEINERALELLEELDTYTQISTSGSGFHCIGRGALPEDTRSVLIDVSNEAFPEGEVEIYDAGRYIAMTGDHISSTPDEMRDISEQVHDYADKYDDVKEPGEKGAERDRERVYDDDEIDAMGSTRDIEAIYDAIDRMSHNANNLESEETHVRGDGTIDMDPSWAKSASGTRLACVGERDGKYFYRDGQIGLSLFQVVALEERIILSERDYPTGADWWKTVEACRKRGWHIPKLDEAAKKDDTEDDVEHVPLIDLCDTTVKKVKGKPDSDGVGKNAAFLSWARDRTQSILERQFGSHDDILLEALPSMGKTYGSVAATAATGEPMTFATGRGQDEQYAHVQQLAFEHNLRPLILPAFQRDCPTSKGEHGDELAEEVNRLHRRGATPKEIHDHYHTNDDKNPLPCQHEGECPYIAKWDFDPDDYDVLIGHYNHLHLDHIQSGRNVVIDEFPSAWENHWSEVPSSQITLYLKHHDEIPFDDYADLMENRDDTEKRAEALAQFSNGVEPDTEMVFKTEYGMADAPLLVFTLLVGAKNNLGNGFEVAGFPDGRRKGTYNREDDAISVIQPPEFTYASSITALDGTPIPEMWRTITGVDLEYVRALDEQERKQYITDGLNIDIIRTTDATKPYLSGNYVTVEQDAALLEWIEERFGEKPGLISSKTAIEDCYETEGILEHTDGTRHYGNVLGSNEFASKHLGAVIGSSNYGDQFVGRWSAYDGEVAKMDHTYEERRGDREFTYGDYGDRILEYMREHQTLQAVLRFGRDGGGSAVFVHTNTLPDWVPCQTGAVVKTWSDGQREIIEAANEIEIDEWTSADIAKRVGYSRRHVRDVLADLADRGYLERHYDGAKWAYSDGELNRIGRYGDVETETVDIDELDVEEAAELERNSVYRWKHRSDAVMGAGYLSTRRDGQTTFEFSEEKDETKKRPAPSD